MSEAVDTQASYKPPREAIIAAEWAAIRGRRNKLLRESDVTQVPDGPYSDDQRIEAAAYRQALRDVPEEVGDPFNVAWPERPSFLK